MKLKLFTLLFVFPIALQIFSKDTTSYYINYSGDKVIEKKAKYLRKVYQNSDKKWAIKDYYLTGQLYKTGTYSKKKLKERNGVFTTYYKNGQVEEQGEYKKGERDGKFFTYYENGQIDSEMPYAKNHLHGKVLSYWEDGTIKRDDNFSNGNFEKGTCFNKEGEKIEHFPFETMPEFPGGIDGLMNYLRENVVYPPNAKLKGIKGKVFVSFIVGKDGVIRDVIILKKVHPLLDNEALRVVKTMPNWKAGRQRGKNVSVSFNLPINFYLSNSK